MILACHSDITPLGIRSERYQRWAIRLEYGVFSFALFRFVFIYTDFYQVHIFCNVEHTIVPELTKPCLSATSERKNKKEKEKGLAQYTHNRISLWQS